MTRTSRKLLAATVTLLASVAMLVTLLAHYADHVLVNSAGFSGRAITVVRSGDVDSLITQLVANRVLAEAGDEASLQPIIEEAVSQAVSNGQVTAEVRAAAQSLQTQLMSGTATSLTLTLPDIGSSIASSVGSESPELADDLREIGTITVLDVPIPSGDASAVHDLANLGRDSSLLLIGTIALIVLALTISPARRRTLLGLGLGALVAGVIAAAIYLVGRGLVVDDFSAQDARTAARAVWSAYLGGLETWGFVLAGAGAVVAFASALL